MTLTEYARDAAARILSANAGAYPITFEQLVRTAAELGFRVTQCGAHSSGMGRHIRVRPASDPRRTLAEGIHELAEALVSHEDSDVRHNAAQRVSDHWTLAYAQAAGCQALQAPLGARETATPIRTEAPTRFEDN